MKKRSLGLSVKIIGLVVLLFVIVLGLIVVIVTSSITEGVRETQIANMENSSRMFREMLDDIFLNISRRVQLVVQKSEVRDAYENNDTDGLQALARASYESLENVYEVAFTDNRGKIIADYPNGGNRGSDVSGLDYWESVSTLMETAYIAPYPRNTPDGGFVLSFASPVVNGNRMVGTMLVSFDMQSFSESRIIPTTYGDSGYAYVFDDRRIPLAHPDTSIVGEILNNDFVTNIIESSDTSGMEYYEYGGRMKYLFFQESEVQPWFIAASIDESDLLSLSIQMRNEISIISGISLIMLILILAIMIMIFVGRPISKVTQSLASGSNSLEAASYQISSSSQELSSGSSELASSIEEITSSIEELQSVVEMNTKNINQSELMMKETTEGTETVTQRMGQLKGAVNEIGENSKRIVKIIKVIEDIAFQTNILALNAAVEAARAGETGRGFAVVADQVKELAHKSSEAAKETASLIEKAIESAEKGETLGDEVMEVQIGAGEKASKVGVLLDEVNRASKEQMRGINQITQAISQTNSVVQQTAASAEETAAASEELAGQAESLNGVVDQLTLMVKGRLENKTSGFDRQQSRLSENRFERKTVDEERDSEAPTPERKKDDTGVSLVSAEEQIPLEEEFSEF